MFETMDQVKYYKKVNKQKSLSIFDLTADFSYVSVPVSIFISIGTWWWAGQIFGGAGWILGGGGAEPPCHLLGYGPVLNSLHLVLVVSAREKKESIIHQLGD